MAPLRTTAVIPLSPYLQIPSHHSLIPFIPSCFHRCPIAHNNPSIVSAAQRGTNKTPIPLSRTLSSNYRLLNTLHDIPRIIT